MRTFDVALTQEEIEALEELCEGKAPWNLLGRECQGEAAESAKVKLREALSSSPA